VGHDRIRLLLATTNAGKARELRLGLGRLPLHVVTLDELGIRAEFSETGATFAENARGKSLFYAGLSGLPTLADDSGLEIDALDGAPGIFSARFSGPGATDARNIRKVLKLLEGVPEVERGARFVCCMDLSHDGRVLKASRGIVRGRILREPRGGFGFGYDPIFHYRPFGRTFGELAASEKQPVSHRGRALRRMIAYLEKALKEGRPSLWEGGTARGGGDAPGGHGKERLRP
jgi:XTP/dITP diphosphohydrolase